MAKLVYVIVVLVLTILSSQIYSNIVYCPYWRYVTQYELIGTILVVSGIGFIIILPMILLGLLGLILYPSTLPLAVAEGIISVVILSLLIMGVVIRIVPWHHWDQHWLLFSTMVIGSGILSAVCGHTARRGFVQCRAGKLAI